MRNICSTPVVRIAFDDLSAALTAAGQNERRRIRNADSDCRFIVICVILTVSRRKLSFFHSFIGKSLYDI